LQAFRALPFDKLAPFVLILILIAECILAIVQASRKPFWYDEIYTYDLSSLRPLSHLWAALQAGGDSMTPTFYGLIVLARTIPGDPHVILRLVSIFGYLLALASVYLFSSRRISPVAGLIATLLLALSAFCLYAIEARAYAILVGLLALSAVLWQRIEEKWWITPAFAVALTLGVSSHYLAIIVLASFGFAELAFFFLFRRIRWQVWISFLISAVPFLLWLPVLMRFRKLFGENYWSKSTWSMALDSYGGMLLFPDTLALVLVVFLFVTGYVIISNRYKETDATSGGFLPHEVVLVMGLLIYPSVLATLTTLMSSGYAFRYGWPAVLGVVLGSLFLFRPKSDKSTAVRLLGALLVVFLIRDVRASIHAVKSPPADADQWPLIARVSRNTPDMPLVVCWGLRYLEMVQYVPPDVRDRLIYVVDPEIAGRVEHHNTVELGVLLLARYVPLHIERPAPFIASHTRFLLYTGYDHPDWLPAYLMERHYRLTLLESDANGSVYVVQN
jgi:hypothetical protein